MSIIFLLLGFNRRVNAAGFYKIIFFSF